MISLTVSCQWGGTPSHNGCFNTKSWFSMTTGCFGPHIPQRGQAAAASMPKRGAKVISTQRRWFMDYMYGTHHPIPRRWIGGKSAGNSAFFCHQPIVLYRLYETIIRRFFHKQSEVKFRYTQIYYILRYTILIYLIEINSEHFGSPKKTHSMSVLDFPRDTDAWPSPYSVFILGHFWYPFHGSCLDEQSSVMINKMIMISIYIYDKILCIYT